jgi:hypothetical protein
MNFIRFVGNALASSIYKFDRILLDCNSKGVMIPTTLGDIADE